MNSGNKQSNRLYSNHDGTQKKKKRRLYIGREGEGVGAEILPHEVGNGGAGHRESRREGHHPRPQHRRLLTLFLLKRETSFLLGEF